MFTPGAVIITPFGDVVFDLTTFIIREGVAVNGILQAVLCIIPWITWVSWNVSHIFVYAWVRLWQVLSVSTYVVINHSYLSSLTHRHRLMNGSDNGLLPVHHLDIGRTKHPQTFTTLLISTFNSLAPGKFAGNFKQVIFKQILVIDSWGISCEIALIWMSLDFIDDQSTLVQVMAWCRQATSHYLSQCWPRSMSPYGITRPQWVNFKVKYSNSHIQGNLG